MSLNPDISQMQRCPAPGAEITWPGGWARATTPPCETQELILSCARPEAAGDDTNSSQHMAAERPKRIGHRVLSPGTTRMPPMSVQDGTATLPWSVMHRK